MTQRTNDDPAVARLKEAFRDNMTPAGVAAAIAFLRTGDNYRPERPEAQQALREVAWLADTLLHMIGVDECNRYFDDLCL